MPPTHAPTPPRPSQPNTPLSSSSAEFAVYAPATVANLGPGYDILGLALTGIGDHAVARLTRANGTGQASLAAVFGDEGKLPRDAHKNTSTAAAMYALSRLGAELDMDLTLYKGLPLGSGLGSSAASAVAGALAAGHMALSQGHTAAAPLNRFDLLDACCQAEQLAAGVAHADNVAPSLLGGVVLIRRYNPLEILRLPAPDDLRVVVVMPNVSVPTREAREVLPQRVRLSDSVSNAGNACAMVAGFFRGDLELIGRCMDDVIVEPARAPLIPAFARVKRAALDAGALGCTISGAGPACFALASDDTRADDIRDAMVRAWASEDVASRGHLGKIDTQGARILTDDLAQLHARLLSHA